MKIETSFNLGDHVLAIYEENKEIHIYDDTISWISVDVNGITYGLSDSYNEFTDKNIILYNDKLNAINKIYDFLNSIELEEE